MKIFVVMEETENWSYDEEAECSFSTIDHNAIRAFSQEIDAKTYCAQNENCTYKELTLDKWE